MLSDACCYKDLTLPYLPFIGAWRTLLAQVPQDVTRALGPDLEVIRRPILQSATPARAPRPLTAAEADQDTLKLFLAVSRATIKLAQHCPTLFIVDDLHWADRSSLDLFGHLVFTVADMAGRAHHRDQDVGPCLAHYERAAEAYRLAGDVQGLARVLMEKAAIQYTLASVPLGTPPDIQPLQDILAAVGEGEPVLRGQIFAIMAQVYRNARQGEKAEAMARRALDIGQRLGDQHLCARASSALALAHLNSRQIKEALESYRSARSARSLVGSTPSSTTNVHKAPISRSRVRANFPASSCRFGDHQFGIFNLLPDSPPCGNGCSRLLLADDAQRRQRDGFEAIPVRAAIA